MYELSTAETAGVLGAFLVTRQLCVLYGVNIDYSIGTTASRQRTRPPTTALPLTSQSHKACRLNYKVLSNVSYPRSPSTHLLIPPPPNATLPFQCRTIANRCPKQHANRYFLSDSTISIEEPRITNSGLSQGKFMRRLQVTRPLNACARDARSAGGSTTPVRATGGGGADGEGGVIGAGAELLNALSCLCRLPFYVALHSTRAASVRL